MNRHDITGTEKKVYIATRVELTGGKPRGGPGHSRFNESREVSRVKLRGYRSLGGGYRDRLYNRTDIAAMKQVSAV